MITLGNNKIAKMYLGATPVATSYLGSQQVYPNASLALSADLLAFAAAGGSQELTVAVEEGQMWALSVPVGWSASSQSGTGTATLTLTIDNNTTTVARSGALTVVSEDLTADVCVGTGRPGRSPMGRSPSGLTAMECFRPGAERYRRRLRTRNRGLGTA